MLQSMCTQDALYCMSDDALSTIVEAAIAFADWGLRCPGLTELARQLYNCGAKVILSSRGAPGLERVRAECVAEHPADNTYVRMKYKERIFPIEYCLLASLVTPLVFGRGCWSYLGNHQTS
jgi:hypothetical protein